MTAFVTGPLLWFSCVFFIAGCLVRLAFPNLRFSTGHLARKRKNKQAADVWQAPFAQKERAGTTDPVPLPLPAWCLVVLVVGLPFFYQGHAELISLHWDIGWPAFKLVYSDILGIAALAVTLLAAFGLVALPKDSGLRRPGVFVLMLLCALPIFTGLMARFRMPGYDFWKLGHILLGEMFLIAIPCTGLFKILLYFLPTRQRNTPEQNG